MGPTIAALASCCCGIGQWVENRWLPTADVGAGDSPPFVRVVTIPAAARDAGTFKGLAAIAL